MNSRTKKLLTYYKPYWRLLLIDILCAFILSGATLLLPLCVRYITKTILVEDTPNMLEQIYIVGFLMIIILVVHTFANLFVSYQGHMMGAKMENDMRDELFNHYQKLSFRFYDEQKTGQLMTRLTNDIFWLSELYHHGPEDLAIALLNFIGTFAILITINVELSLLAFLFVPIMAIYAFYFNRRMNHALRRSKDRIGDINAQVEDTLAGIRVVKSFTNEAIEKQKFTHENRRLLESRADGYRSEAYFYEGMVVFTHLIMIVVVIIGGIAIVQSHLDLADLITYILYIGILIEPVNRVVNFTRLYQEGITGFHRFMDMLEITPDIHDKPDAITVHKINGHITFDNVSFHYNDRQGDVLKNINLHIDAGEYVALVGISGAGKSTLCSLIPRFYDVTGGGIYLDDTDIRDITLESLRKQIGIVAQDVYLFSGTVADNIRYGKPDASFDEIVTSAKKANAHNFIMALPDGYETDIGQRGVKLSGGQRQRLSIARVFLKDPAIILFDEATSALDNESERAVKQSLEVLSDNRTTLVIAHRLSTIRNAQRIIVLGDGRILEQGTHEDLMLQNGHYADLYNLQLTL